MYHDLIMSLQRYVHVFTINCGQFFLMLCENVELAYNAIKHYMLTCPPWLAVYLELKECDR